MLRAMPAPSHLHRLTTLPPGWDALRDQAEAEGFRFLTRLEAEWRDGANRFDRPGELLLGALDEGAAIALCGLNQDPYAGQASIGRLRHLYVAPAWRRQGIATLLLQAVVAAARPTFQSLRLRTGTEAAAHFYRHHGFLPVEDASATHILTLHMERWG
jgi:GNAT superfamily N-acetyltransferase